eukprot:2665986-Rhodomonas_salina.2
MIGISYASTGHGIGRRCVSTGHHVLEGGQYRSSISTARLKSAVLSVGRSCSALRYSPCSTTPDLSHRK